MHHEISYHSTIALGDIRHGQHQHVHRTSMNIRDKRRLLSGRVLVKSSDDGHAGGSFFDDHGRHDTESDNTRVEEVSIKSSDD